MSDETARRDELRRLSEARGKVGLSPYPTDAEILGCAFEYNISKIEAHERLMREGERILAVREKKG